MGKQPPSSRPPWDWFSAILVFLLVQVAATRLAVTKWAPNLSFAETLGGLGVVLGLALGFSAFQRRSVRWLALLYSLVIPPWRWIGAVEAEASYLERLSIVGGRMWFSFVQFFSRKPVDDSLFIVVLFSLGFWIIGLTAGYVLARHNNPLGAIIPAGVAILAVQIYDGFLAVRLWGSAVFIFLALVLLGRSYFRKNREIWKEKHVLVAGESGEEFARGLMLLAAVLVFIAWSLPASFTSLKSASDAWDRFARPIRERLNNAVTSLDSPYGTGGSGDFYAEDLFLGRTAAIGDATVFTVSVNSTTGQPPERYYWRGRVYDSYEGGQWVNTSRASRDFAPETDEVNLPITAGPLQDARLTFTLQLVRQRLIYAPAGTFWVNRPARVYSVTIPGRRDDISAWMAEPSLAGGDKYQVHAQVTNPSILDLQNAGTDYPSWVSARYLNVPEKLLPTLGPLARQVTQGQATPYDRAQAITAYLRDEIEYSNSLDPAPRGVDPLLWVLTESKKGFCMYYASAEVLMLRSIGIPARMAVGFAQGIRDPETGVFSVRRQDSHAWPEVYFPEIGWVEFEPTSNQAPLVRPASPQAIPTPIGELGGLLGGGINGRDEGDRFARLENVDVVDTPLQQTPLGRILFSGIGLLIAAALVLLNRRFSLLDRLPAYISGAYTRSGSRPPAWVDRWERWVHLGSIERSFQAVNFSLRAMGRPQRMHITPAERAAALQAVLPSESGTIQDLLLEHQSALYTTRSGSPKRARRLAWRLVSRALLARLRSDWERFDRRFSNFG